MITEKRCPRCKQVKPASAFSPSSRSASGLVSWCKGCISDRAKAKRKTPEGKRAERGYVLKYKYGITLEQYDAMLRVQDGRCAICHRKPRKKPLSVDHDHSCCPGSKSCGKCIRGLLCVACNYNLLGYVLSESANSQEALGTLKRAVIYLERGGHESRYAT